MNMVYSFSLFVSSKNRYHAECEYIESGLLVWTVRLHRRPLELD